MFNTFLLIRFVKDMLFQQAQYNYQQPYKYQPLYTFAKMQGEIGKHTVLQSEIDAFTQQLNEGLRDDKDLKNKLPINPKDIFDSLEDGVMFCKFINCAVTGRVPPISPEAINIKPANTYHKLENLNLAISSAKAIGCTVINIRPEFIMEKREHIVFGLLWQIIKIRLSNQVVNLKKHPQIIVLKKEDEDDEYFKKLNYEEILIRWLNYHIKKNGGTKVVKNLGNDLADSEAYGHVLTNVANLDKQFWGKDKKARSQQVIATCHKQKISTKVRPEDIESGNTKLNTILCVDIFNQRHGLEVKQKVIVETPPEQETDQTREIRVFKNWINSQGIEDVYVSYLMHDLRDGRILLKVLDNFKPKTVDWQGRYSNRLNSRIHIIQNCNYVVEICKNMGVKVIGVDGIDIVDGKVNLTLGLVWQICKMYWEERVGKINEEQLIAWGNSKVSSQFHIKSLRDPSISNCQYLLHIIESIKKDTVDFSKIRQANSEDDQIANINYTIACARKLGAQILTLWEHIKESNSRFIAIFLAELRHIEKNFSK